MGGKTLTRADLAEAVVRRIGLPRNESADLVELVLGEISTSLEAGEQVKLSSFGSFGVREKKAAHWPQSKNRRRSSNYTAPCFGLSPQCDYEKPH